ncbi:hypothetical protein [Eleftheria terrae]|uniref:hypothetical protein n=1 Tax=Eleftheria terrae TaxID=1597781 RepID=UPI00263AE508|nr:hypothetical protein [Eleftheria terrae]WKB54409.1 hypothetical protein N7L95_08495 [Eleftheria terrae]
MAEGDRRSGAGRQAAADEIVACALEEYGTRLESAGQKRARADFERCLQEAQETLTLLEHLWLECAIPEIVAATRSLRSSTRLLGICRTWLDFRRNDAEPAIRDREHRLSLEAAQRCGDRVALFFDTGMQEWLNALNVAHECSQVESVWLREVRLRLTPAVVHAALQFFEQPYRVAAVAATQEEDGGRFVWLLDSPASPLYQEPHQSRLLELLERSTTVEDRAAARIIADNAFDYLRLTNAVFRGGTNMVKLAAFARERPALFRAAWAATISVEPQFRAVHSLMHLRQRLLRAGVDAALLREPDWLRVAENGAAQLRTDDTDGNAGHTDDFAEPSRGEGNGDDVAKSRACVQDACVNVGGGKLLVDQLSQQSSPGHSHDD